MSNVYDIGVKLTMASNHAQVLSALSQGLLGVHAKADKLTGTFNKLKLAVGGALAATAGIATLKVMQGMIDKGNELVRVQRNMAQAGATAAQVQEAYAKAWEQTAKYKNIGATEIMKMINDARGTFGDQNVATHEVEAITRSASFLRAYQGSEKGKSSHAALLAEMNAALKSGEIAGKITPQEMFSHIDELTAMKVAFGDQVKIGQYLTAQRAAGASARNWDDDFRYGAFAALAQENGSRGGTMLNTLGNKIVGSSGWTTQAARNAMGMGLIDPSKAEYDTTGRLKRLEPGAVNGWETFAKNPQLWVDQFLKPKLSSDPLTQSQQITSIFPNQNAARAITEMVQQGPKFHKDAALVVEALKNITNGGMGKYTAGSYDYQLEAFHAQWNNLITALGSAMVPEATRQLAKLNEVLTQMAQWSGNKDNAEFLTMIGKGVGVFALALTAGGGAAILAALGPAGWLVAGITALGAALAVFQPDILTQIANALKFFFDTVAKGFGVLKGAMGGGGGAEGSVGNGGVSPDVYGFGGATVQKQSLNSVTGIPNTGGHFGIKPGASSGAFHPALLDAVRAGGAGRVTALNDAYHAHTGSKHAAGLAVDMTGNPASIMARTRASMAAAGLVEGRDYKMINEYAHLSRRATGGHVHFQFQTRRAADQFRSHAAPPPPANNGSGQMVQNHIHLDGQKIAQVVTRHQVRGANGPSQGANYFDGSRGMPQVA